MSEEGDYTTTNFHLRWLDNIYESLRRIQSMHLLAKEGCENIMDYLEIPPNQRKFVIPETQYKNMRLMAFELEIVLDNLKPIPEFKEDVKKYEKELIKVLDKVDERNFFLKDVISNNRLSEIQVLPFLKLTINLLIGIKSKVLEKIAPILYLDEGTSNKKKW